MLKLLHTADIQLDAPFTFLGTKGAPHRQQLRETFARIVQIAEESGYDMLLIAGDLFNNNHPSQSTVDFVRRQLGRLDIPVIILPGNHDSYDKRSVYRRESFPPNVHILTEQPTYLDCPDLDLTVAGRPLASSHDSKSPLLGVARQGERRWFVALAHGNMQIGMVESSERPIQPDEIAATQADYVALGDWHSFADCSQGGVTAYYAGAPEPTGVNQEGSGYVAGITLTETGVQVDQLRVGRTRAYSIELDVTGLTEGDVIARLRDKADPDLMLAVNLTGMKAIDHFLDVETIQQAAADGFYWLRVRDKAVTALDSIDPADYPETQVIGQYIHLLSERIESASTEHERHIAEEALQLGVALLQGKEVLR